MKPKPLERQPVILSLLILKEMGIAEEQHSKFSDEWQPLWVALINYRDSKKHEQWNQQILENLLAGKVDLNAGEKWVILNDCLNRIWEKANGG